MLGEDDYPALERAMEQESSPVKAMDADTWAAARAAHQGYQAGMQLLSILPYIAAKTDFYALSVNPDLSIHIPEPLLDEALQKRMEKVLVPPPAAKSDEILAASGGMYYPREAPGSDAYVSEGDHFEAGDVLYIVEVMKMFNKVTATFAGTIDKVLVEEDGVIISKGQPLFKVKPDEEIIIESPEEMAARKRKASDGFLAANAG